MVIQVWREINLVYMSTEYVFYFSLIEVKTDILKLFLSSNDYNIHNTIWWYSLGRFSVSDLIAGSFSLPSADLRRCGYQLPTSNWSLQRQKCKHILPKENCLLLTVISYWNHYERLTSKHHPTGPDFTPENTPALQQ
jgi:hypothetical protein